ncbi:MAG: hypothetical protein KAT52_04205 [Desulfobacterales bacterium]|nr:hypothetical protein [Desulfobacterales bacterium]
MKITEKNRRQLILRHVQSIALSNFPDLEEFLERIEYFLKRERKSILKRAKERITNDLPNDVASSLWEDYGVELGQFENTFPEILRYSLFTMLMSMTEASIVTLCHGVRQIFKLEKSFNQRKSDVINEGIKKYLKKHLCIDTSGYTDLIELVDSFRKLRNCIVHSKGRIAWRTEKEEADLRKFIESTPTLEINHYGQIVILEGFIKISMHNAKLLVQRLLESIREKLE